MKILSVSSVSSVSVLLLALIGHAEAAEQAPPVLKAGATVVFERVNAPALTVVYFADGRDCTGRRPLPMLDGAVREGVPVPIEVGREIAFWLRQAQGVQAFGPLNVGEVCEVMVSFTPISGANYRLTYRVSPDGKQCGAALARLQPGRDGRSEKEPTFRVRTPLTPSLEDRPVCAP